MQERRSFFALAGNLMVSSLLESMWVVRSNPARVLSFFLPEHELME
jgi:hypothetical protein